MTGNHHFGYELADGYAVSNLKTYAATLASMLYNMHLQRQPTGILYRINEDKRRFRVTTVSINHGAYQQ